jgi:hypothetical protein
LVAGPSRRGRVQATRRCSRSQRGPEPLAGMPAGLLGNMGLLPDHSSQGPFYSDEHLWLDFHKHQAVLDGQMLTLTRKEYGVRALLVEHSGQIVPREALLRLIWATAPGSGHAPWTCTFADCGENWGHMRSSTSKQSAGPGTAFSRSRRRRSKASCSSWPPSLREHHSRGRSGG